MIARILSVALIIELLAPAAAFASTTGSLMGTVTDRITGAPIDDAMVVVESPSEHQQTTTDSRGSFAFVSLTPDTDAVLPETPFYDINGTSIYALHFVPGLTFGPGSELAR